MPWAGQAAAASNSLGLQCDLSAPATVDVKQAAASLQSSYLASIADSSSIKVQQYLRMREAVTPDTYGSADLKRIIVTRFAPRAVSVALLSFRGVAGGGAPR